MPKGFVSLGKGMTLNEKLVKEVVMSSNGRYYINGVYGESYQVDKKHYKKAKLIIDNK